MQEDADAHRAMLPLSLAVMHSPQACELQATVPEQAEARVKCAPYSLTLLDVQSTLGFAARHVPHL